MKKDSSTPPEDFEITKEEPVKSKRTDVARGIINRLDKGESVLVSTYIMANTMQRCAGQLGRYATYKQEGECYRVWLF